MPGKPEMAEAASRVDAATSYRERDPAGSRRKKNEKPPPKPGADPSLEALEPGEPDESEKHELDTMA